MLVYAPDALGRRLIEHHPMLHNNIQRCAPVELEIQSVFPPKTPICFTTMWTGAMPSVHGVVLPERKPFTGDTIFDAMVRAGKNPAIVTIRNSTNDVMFREREMDYFIEESDELVTARTLRLIESDKHDFILAYHQEYDDTLHGSSGPFSNECIAAFQRHVQTFEVLAHAVDQFWGKHNRALAFTPDHGGHIDDEQGCGTHGLDIPEDMDLYHYFGIWPGV